MSVVIEKKLSQDEKFARIRLSRSENVGPITYKHLIAKYKSATSALEVLPSLAQKGGGKRQIKICKVSTLEKEISGIKAFGAKFLILGDIAYPKLLTQVEDAPPIISVKGHQHLLEKPSIGIVGARNASAIGHKIARTIAQELGEEGYIITSGLARGIDTSAHIGALSTGTIAALGGGIDIFYPKENRDLQNQISNEGLLISEQPLGTKPQARHFPRRNRIISGLSKGVLVIEAAMKSGSLITARLALEQNREVFAVPGSPLDPRSNGTNNLIKQGAALVENSGDVLEALKTITNLSFEDPVKPLFDENYIAQEDSISDKKRRVVQERLSPTPVEIDEIIRQVKLETSEVLTIILELELAGLAVRHPGNKVSLL